MLLDSLKYLESKFDFSPFEGLDSEQRHILSHTKALLKSLPNPPTNGWERVRLGELGQVRMCKRVMKSETNDIEGIPFYKIGTFGGKADSYIHNDLYQAYKTKYPYPKREDVLISAAGTLGKAVVFDGEDAYFQDSNIVWIDNNQIRVSNAFLYALCVNVIDWQKAGTRGGVIRRLYNDNIRAIQIPLPPIEAQQQISTAIKSFESIAQNMEVKMQNLESKKAEILDHFLNT